jgi:lipopolysaccharide export system permease protein
VIVAFAIGVIATTAYNPVSAIMQEQSKRYEAMLFGNKSAELHGGGPFWTSQRSSDGQAIINAKASRDQGVNLTGVTFFIFDNDGHFKERVDARTATLEHGVWALMNARVNKLGTPPTSVDSYQIKTNLTPEQARESFATPETVPFWDLPEYISIADHAGLVAAGYKYQFQKLIAQPFLLAAMVFLAASVSLRFFRFGGVQKMILSGVAAGFLLYVLSKVTEDMTKAELMLPVAAAWLPVLAGGVTGFIALLYQEDG